MNNSVLDKDYKYFIENMPAFYKKYGHRFLVIKNQGVLGDYDTFKSALDATLTTEKLGTFLVQECFKDKKQAVNHFQGNVAISKRKAA
ncbi:hypothetical protein NO2_0404 [Candidatus Termititenax persephonae]|uniref:DUF5678 domain-containing protein n=1 Tax=Candidatus Termititenax persephonae TaxID=2218525 RepID=A0A388TFE9_9BACT|nr:hypothetical protein NO2_0404 [Candidatus Termititenax persephonae]